MIATKINRLKETKAEIKNAIIEKGVNVSNEDTFFSYADKIRNIQSGGTMTPSTDDWQPEPDWWDIEKIIEEDTEDYEQKIICLLTDELDEGATNNFVQGAEKYKLSDGQVIIGTGGSISINNAFDTTIDKECSKGYKTRYVIYYRNSDFDNTLSIPNNTIYTVFSGVNFNNKPFQNRRFLQAVKFVNNSKFISSNASSMFNGCCSLQSIDGFDTSNVTSMSSMLYSCYSLRKTPNFNTSKATTMFGMYLSCCNLRTISNIDGNNSTNMGSIVSACYCLTNIDNIRNIKVNVSFSGATNLNHSTLLRILNALVDLTDQITQTLTLGSTNLAKLTDEEKAIATEKNWTLA